MAGRVVVRRAVVTDAEAGARCHGTCWREAYGDLVDPALLVERFREVDGRTAYWRRVIADGSDYWVAVHPSGDDVPVGDRLTGFAASGPCRDDDAPEALELYAIYVRKGWWGSGLADRLLEVAIGRRSASLWVFEGNARARRFYARHGFRVDGARKDEPFFGVAEVRMVR